MLQTLQDIKRSLDPNGNHAVAIDLLIEKNEILDDLVWVQGNELTGHTTTQTVSAPTVYDVAYNEGTDESKSGKRQVTEQFSIMEGNSSVDAKVANIMPSVDAWRSDEDAQFVNALNTRLSYLTFYGNRALFPKQFTGLDPRFNTPSTDEDNSGYNLISGSGAGADNMSIWLVGWSSDTVHMGYPKNSKAGLQINNMGLNKSYDSNGKVLWTYDTNFLWNVGLVVRDWRKVVRICNIDKSNLTKDAATGADIIDLMSIATEVMGSTSGLKPAFYCNKTAKTFLNRQARNALTGSTLSYADIMGRSDVMTFQGIPVRVCEQLTNAEAAVAGTFEWS